MTLDHPGELACGQYGRPIDDPVAYLLESLMRHLRFIVNRRRAFEQILLMQLGDASLQPANRRYGVQPPDGNPEHVDLKFDEVRVKFTDEDIPAGRAV